MATIECWYDEDTETWLVMNAADNRLLIELRRHAEYDIPGDPWLPENPCLLRTLDDESSIEVEF